MARTLTIISGGQTGVDRAALDTAMELGLPTGGWCPAGRIAEDGRIDERYPLRETPSARYAQRTRWNVRDSDATLIIARQPLTRGTRLTQRCAIHEHRPCLVVAPEDQRAVHVIHDWLRSLDVATLNVAGPRESQQPGIGRQAAAILRAALSCATLDHEESR